MTHYDSPGPTMPPYSPAAKDIVMEHYSGSGSATILASDVFANAKFEYGELTIEVAPEGVVGMCGKAKDDGYNFLEDVTAVDWYPTEPRFQICYSILSMSMKKRLRVITRLNGDSPVVDSITSVWPSANFYEREVFDLFGVRFAGHPRLTRIMMPDNWNGHPLRKDYPVEGYR